MKIHYGWYDNLKHFYFVRLSLTLVRLPRCLSSYIPLELCLCRLSLPLVRLPRYVSSYIPFALFVPAVTDVDKIAQVLSSLTFPSSCGYATLTDVGKTALLFITSQIKSFSKLSKPMSYIHSYTHPLIHPAFY